MMLCLGTTPVFQRTMIVDRFALDAVNRAAEVYDYASGKSINVAHVIHTLGKAVLATGFVGGARGEALRRDLDSIGIPNDFVTVAPETRQCVTVVDRSTGTATELVEESAPVGPEAWQAIGSKLRALLPAASIWVFSGTLAPDADPDFYAHWLPLARQVGAHVIVDARGEPLRRAMQHPNVILKMNRDELAATLGADLSDEAALIAAMREHAPPEGQLIVTMGAGGAVAGDRQNLWRVRSPRLEAVNAVGSGDAFAAGLAVALADSQPLSEALRLGAACGAANALTSRAGYVDAGDVDRLLASVHIEKQKSAHTR